jgi:hypothetical protein
MKSSSEAARRSGSVVSQRAMSWRISASSNVILSFRVSRGCDLRCPVVDSVADETLAA